LFLKVKLWERAGVGVPTGPIEIVGAILGSASTRGEVSVSAAVLFGILLSGQDELPSDSLATVVFFNEECFDMAPVSWPEDLCCDRKSDKSKKRSPFFGDNDGVFIGAEIDAEPLLESLNSCGVF
jgi:hypothetical protein